MKNSVIAALFVTVALRGYSQTCTVDWTDARQRIDGFGASSAWATGWTAAQADMFFSTNVGIGLSLIRSHIKTNGITSDETDIMLAAQERGARVWSAPWTPLPQFKDTNSFNGGNLVGTLANYQAWAKLLATYVRNMNQLGINIYALSVQNEPDVSTTNYESCKWTGPQFHDFVTNLYATLVASNLSSVKILIPESQHWSSNPGLYTNTMNDANVAPMVGIIADHNYDFCPPSGTPAALNSYGKPLWETEVSKLSCAGAFDPSIADGLYWAQRIHLFLTSAQANAWHYWWLISGNPDNEGLTDQLGNPAKRMYVLGNFSRFVRPNFNRIGVVNSGNTFISAYRDTNSAAFAIVAINTDFTGVNQTFNLSHLTGVPPNVTPWITASNYSLTAFPAVPVSGSSFTYLLPGRSVVTFVGQATNTAPVILPQSDQTIDVSSGLEFYLEADDPDMPPQSLTFAVENGPPGLTLLETIEYPGASYAHYFWQPQNSDAGTTNVITISATDNGSPALFATNSFTVIVNPLPNTAPSLTAIPDQTVDVGVLLVVTNVATDAEVPPQILAFSLLSGPGDSTLNGSNGVFSWRPTSSAANSTNLIAVKVVDNGVPALSATNEFHVVVNPLSVPLLRAISLSGGQPSFTVDGPAGQNYTLWTSANLIDWTVLYTTNPPTMPVTLSDTNSPADPERFYRIQLGP